MLLKQTPRDAGVSSAMPSGGTNLRCGFVVDFVTVELHTKRLFDCFYQRIDVWVHPVSRILASNIEQKQGECAPLPGVTGTLSDKLS